MYKKLSVNGKQYRYILFVIIGLLISMSAFVFILNDVQPVSAGVSFQPKWSEVLFLGVPYIAQAQKQPPVKVVPAFNKSDVLQNLLLLVSNIDIRNIKTFIDVEIPLIAAVRTGKSTVSAVSLPHFPKFDPNTIKVNGKPLIGIYHTHTSESFIPISGSAHARGGQTGDIVTVGEALKNKLEKNGVIAIHAKTVHDFPSFMKAYSASEITVKSMLEAYPSIQMIFDIHRDAEKRESVVATVNGVECAKLLFVVATGQTDLPQPNWQQNYAFAKLIDAKLNEHFPGLSKGIQLVDWRYNQHLHPRALLIEAGSHENREDEVIRSIEMLADVITEIIAEGSE